MADDAAPDFTSLAADIVAAYVSYNKVAPGALSTVIGDVRQALKTAGEPLPPAEPQTPKPDKAAVRKSMSHEHLTSFLDGRKYKSLTRHLTSNGLTPAEYRERFGLPKDYPMVAPEYSARRGELARSLGLGRKPAQAHTPAAEPAPAKRGRRKQAEQTQQATQKPASKAIRPEDESFD